ncbi:CMRF35-like molecule 7 [Cyprinus carpio]|uniref:CMRF35-like molecule 7 n=1 Tax=Cyprinus carpio TaxID=7962 RepID=A0A9Q9YRG9_CYPCA|nr:CMRF35-like molecule 7 [Cyprinus carpio]
MKIIWTFTLLMIPDVVSSISVTGYSDGEVNITCRYMEKDTQNTKYFCKGKTPEKEKGKWCIELIRTEEKDKWVHSGRFSLYDDTRAAVFTVTFGDLNELDSGTYQCAVDRTTTKDSYTEVKMNVRKERDEHQTTSSSLSSVKPPLITSPSPVKGSSLVISVSVLLLLIVPVILLVMVTLWRRRQSHNADSSSKSSHTTPTNIEAVSHAGCDNKEIKDAHKQLPTNPSDSSEATGDSQIFITSAEDLNYAVVNFQKKALCPDRMNYTLLWYFI